MPKKISRCSIPLASSFRMLLIGAFGGMESERGICWPSLQLLFLRELFGLAPSETVPDRAPWLRIRSRLPLARPRGLARAADELILVRIGDLNLLILVIWQPESNEQVDYPVTVCLLRLMTGDQIQATSKNRRFFNGLPTEVGKLSAGHVWPH